MLIICLSGFGISDIGLIKPDQMPFLTLYVLKACVWNQCHFFLKCFIQFTIATIWILSFHVSRSPPQFDFFKRYITSHNFSCACFGILSLPRNFPLCFRWQIYWRQLVPFVIFIGPGVKVLFGMFLSVQLSAHVCLYM